jgi:hypothetical protein
MVCRLCPFARVLVSPLDEGTLAAAGVLAEHLLKKNLDRPRRVPLDEPSRGFLEAVGQDLDESLGSDGIGRMAYLMRGGMPVCNQTMLRRGVSPFHGRVLSITGWWSNPVFLMNSQTADSFFPEEPISTKIYAATGVPVRVHATEEFKKETKWPKDEVDLFVSSEDTAGLPTMLNLVSLSCGRKWLASSDPKDVAIPASMPFFRHNRAYNVGGELWSRVVLNEAN